MDVTEVMYIEEYTSEVTQEVLSHSRAFEDIYMSYEITFFFTLKMT